MISDPTPTPAPSRPGDPAVLRALAGMLAAAHAAAFAASAAGGSLAPLGPEAKPALDLTRLAYADHRRLRNRLVAATMARGGTPAPAEPAYRLPIEPVDPTSALRLLADVEDRSAAATYEALSALTGSDRELAVDALVAMTLRGQRARLTAGAPPAAATDALPGGSQRGRLAPGPGAPNQSSTSRS